MTNNKNKISIPQLQHFSHIITRPFKAAFSRIGFKLILLILLVLALAMGSLILLSTRLVTEFGEYSAAVNEKHIKEKTALLLSRLMDDQTQRYEEVFNKIALSSAVIAHEAGVLMDHRNGLFRSISPQIDLTFYPTNQFFSNKASDPIQILYWGGNNHSGIYSKRVAYFIEDDFPLGKDKRE